MRLRRDDDRRRLRPRPRPEGPPRAHCPDRYRCRVPGLDGRRTACLTQPMTAEPKLRPSLQVSRCRWDHTAGRVQSGSRLCLPSSGLIRRASNAVPTEQSVRAASFWVGVRRPVGTPQDRQGPGLHHRTSMQVARCALTGRKRLSVPISWRGQGRPGREFVSHYRRRPGLGLVGRVRVPVYFSAERRWTSSRLE